jgi:chromosomal replication initiator protein
MLKIVVKVDLTTYLIERIVARHTSAEINMENILNVISYELDIPISDIKSKNREGELPDARKLYCLLARDYTGKSLRTIGKLVNIDHSSVIVAIRKARFYIKSESDFRNKYNSIKERLGLR